MARGKNPYPTWRRSQYRDGSWGDEQVTKNHSKIVAALEENLGSLKGLRIMDIGCGNGSLMSRLAEKGAEVWGVDAVWAHIEAAKRRGLKNLIKGEAEALASLVPGKIVRAGGFDAVVSSLFLEKSVLQYAQQRRVLAQAAAVTKPDGIHVHWTGQPDGVPMQGIQRIGMRPISSKYADGEGKLVVLRKNPLRSG